MTTQYQYICFSTLHLMTNKLYLREKYIHYTHNKSEMIDCFICLYVFQLYLTSDQKTFLKSSKKSHLQEVSLTDQPSYETCWQFVYLDPQMRMEHEGFPVPVCILYIVVITMLLFSKALKAFMKIFNLVIHIIQGNIIYCIL